MSLPGDKQIDTDPEGDPDPVEIIHSACDTLEETPETIELAHEVLRYPFCMDRSKLLANRVLKKCLRGREQFLDTIREQATRQHERLVTLKEHNSS